MKTEFIIPTGTLDSCGDIILPNAFKNLPKTIPVTHDFDTKKPIGSARIFNDNGSIKVKAEIRTL